jgi:hypothetical protein
MAEEKPQEAESVGVPGRSDLDAGAAPRVPSNACWVCGEPVGPTFVVMHIKRGVCTGTEPINGMIRILPALECVRMHHSCHRTVLVVGYDK